MINACGLADFLLGLVSKQEGATALVLSYKKALTANYPGMEPESLSRSPKDLQKTGDANRGQQVRIANVFRLPDFTKNSSTGSHVA